MRLGLINYEGDCLSAIKEDGKIYIRDQYGVDVEILNTKTFLNFIDGNMEITDSRGKSWNYLNESMDSKPQPSKIFDFIMSAENSKKTDRCQTKLMKIKLESLDPTGVPTKVSALSMEIIDDPECMRHERLFLHIGESLYYIDNKGYIKERIVPKEDNKTF